MEFALISAAAEFNSGPLGRTTVKRSLGFQEGELGQRLGQARLKKRLYKSTFQEQQKAKKRKKVTATAKEKARQRCVRLAPLEVEEPSAERAIGPLLL